MIISQLNDPGSKASYIFWGFFSVGYLLEVSSLTGYFAKNVKNEVRGVLYGFAGLFAMMGKGLCLLVSR